jgi:transposase InsO family protein
MPLPVPINRWSDVSMDFMTDLPRTQSGKETLMVVVDRLTKMAHFIPLGGDPTAEGVAEAYVRNVFRLHGVPKTIVSDRDSKFTSNFWQTFWRRLGTKLSMSTASHPETDGQTENMNRTINMMICTLIGPSRDWETLLPLIEFA